MAARNWQKQRRRLWQLGFLYDATAHEHTAIVRSHVARYKARALQKGK